ncbi:hypothetical protein IAQ61_009915 [Plenodomus lingam]|uniref:uncharacterized protein n=1 Tax=Leptosphaeria maculans TaxID=5022 RepID=UPI00332AF1D4|nr:hypothetical protein IAQ61_009915 [Plenodomus lingam]
MAIVACIMLCALGIQSQVPGLRTDFQAVRCVLRLLGAAGVQWERRRTGSGNGRGGEEEKKKKKKKSRVKQVMRSNEKREEVERGMRGARCEASIRSME